MVEKTENFVSMKTTGLTISTTSISTTVSSKHCILLSPHADRHAGDISFTVYPAVRSIGRDTKFTVPFYHSLCTVADFSAGALPIGVKFYMAV